MFKCDMCGLCCQNLKNVDLYKDLDRGDGVCKYLVKNLCSIYNDRPLKCRIDDSYEYFFRNMLSLEEYYEMNRQVCECLKSNK